MRRLAPSALALLLAGCAVGPDFERPDAPEGKGYGVELAKPDAPKEAKNDGQRLVENMDIPEQWWQLFNCAKLDKLVEQSLQGNPSVDAAKAALRQAHELYSAQWTALLPVVTGGLSQQRAKFAPATISTPTSNNNPYYSLYTAQLTLSYSPDVFGGTRREIEAAKAGEEQTRYQLEATYLTLSSTVVVTVIQEGSLRAQIDATNRLITIEHDLTEAVRRQHEIGTAANLDLRLQETTEAQTRALLPPLQKQLNQSRDALAALLGGFPDEAAALDEFRLADLTLPRELPVSLPSKLVAQRPDIRQAEENLHQATAEVGVAINDELPQFSIDGNIGSTALSTGNLFGSGTGFWSLGTSLTQTLFDAGALLHKRRAADAAMDQAAAQYRGTVVGAVQNVADTLRALQADTDAVHDNGAAARSAEDALDIAKGQYKLGTVSLVALLTAEIAYQQAELASIQAVANRYSDTAGLFQALGGGWWNRPDTTAETVKNEGER